jgi:hypothetical protein
MATILDDRASRLLELLQEADDEAVTLGELEVVGVVEPAEALLALELAGHTFERVYAMGSGERPLECVRLSRAGAPAVPRPLNPAPVAARRAAVAEPRPTARPPLAALALLVLAVLLLGLARGAARRR